MAWVDEKQRNLIWKRYYIREKLICIATHAYVVFTSRM